MKVVAYCALIAGCCRYANFTTLGTVLFVLACGIVFVLTTRLDDNKEGSDENVNELPLR